MSKRIVFMGAGAAGGYVGGHLARTGEDVTLIDSWPEHIEYIKHNDIHLKRSGWRHQRAIPQRWKNLRAACWMA